MVAIINEKECIACGVCVQACAQEALTVEDMAKVNSELCIDCEACVDECPSDAITMG